MAARGRLKLGESIFHHSSGREHLSVRTGTRITSKSEQYPCVLLERRSSDYTVTRIELSAAEARTAANTCMRAIRKRSNAKDKPEVLMQESDSALRVVLKKQTIARLVIEHRDEDRSVKRIELSASEAGSVAAVLADWARGLPSSRAKADLQLHPAMVPLRRPAQRASVKPRNERRPPRSSGGRPA